MLAIGGVGGLAIGLAGREILENLFTGLIILSSSPFEVGEEVLFTPSSGPVSHISCFRLNFPCPPVPLKSARRCCSPRETARVSAVIVLIADPFHIVDDVLSFQWGRSLKVARLIFHDANLEVAAS